MLAPATARLIAKRFRIVRALRRGVFQARDGRRQVSLEVLPAADLDVPGLRRSIAIAAGLDHPNIAGMYEVVELGTHVGIVSQLIDGVSIADRLELGPFEPLQVGVLLGQLLSALECAHGAGLAHGELSPETTMIDELGQLRVCNLGVYSTNCAPRSDLIATGVLGRAMLFGSRAPVPPQLERWLERCDSYADASTSLRALLDRTTVAVPDPTRNTTPAAPPIDPVAIDLGAPSVAPVAGVEPQAASAAPRSLVAEPSGPKLEPQASQSAFVGPPLVRTDPDPGSLEGGVAPGPQRRRRGPWIRAVIATGCTAVIALAVWTFASSRSHRDDQAAAAAPGPPATSPPTPSTRPPIVAPGDASGAAPPGPASVAPTATTVVPDVPTTTAMATATARISFSAESTWIETPAVFVLEQAYRQLVNNPSARVEISGHSSDDGDREKNLQLSVGRATAVKNYLVQRGIPPSRLEIVARGATQPIGSNATAEGRAQNRRAELRFSPATAR